MLARLVRMFLISEDLNAL